MIVATESTLSDRIDSWLPQTQCTRCGYPRCRDYADAIASGQADINRCPPGGDVTLQALAELMQTPMKPLDPDCGAARPRARVAIDEANCIGCRKCIDACPVDAIVGARKLMHTVIATECNGCELCIPPCPVDCILTLPTPAARDERWSDYSMEESAHWRDRTEQRLQRLARIKTKPAADDSAGEGTAQGRERMREEIRAAVERVRERRSKRDPNPTGTKSN